MFTVANYTTWERVGTEFTSVEEAAQWLRENREDLPGHGWAVFRAEGEGLVRLSPEELETEESILIGREGLSCELMGGAS